MESKLSFFIVLSILLTLIKIGDAKSSVPVKDCGSPYVELLNLEIIPCQKDICTLTRGENVTVIADFVFKTTSKQLAINVYHTDWNLGLDSVLWHKKDVCGKWGVTCPAVEGEAQRAVFGVTLPKSLPTLKLRMKLVSIGDFDRQLSCHSVPLEVV